MLVTVVICRMHCMRAIILNTPKHICLFDKSIITITCKTRETQFVYIYIAIYLM